MSDVHAPPSFLDALLAEAELTARLDRPPPESQWMSPAYLMDRQGRTLHHVAETVTKALAWMQRLASGPGSRIELDAIDLESLVAATEYTFPSRRLTEARQRQLQALFLGDVDSAILQSRSESACPVESLGDLWAREGSEAEEPPPGAPETLHPVGWVLIAGLGTETLPRELERAAGAIGAVIAATGHGLIAGGWPGVDQHTTDGFLARLTLDRRPPSSWLRIYVEPKRESRVVQGTIEALDTVEESIKRSVEEADVVILVSGAGGTARIGRAALAMDVPVLAMAGSGGDAERMYNEACEALENWKGGNLGDGLRLLGRPLEEALFALPGLLLELAARREASQRHTLKRPVSKRRPRYRPQ